MYISPYPLPLEPPFHCPTTFYPSRSSRSTKLGSMCPTSYIFYTWWCIYVNTTVSICPILSVICCVHSSVLYICASVPALQINSSGPLFQILYVNICYLFFSFISYSCVFKLSGVHLIYTGLGWACCQLYVDIVYSVCFPQLLRAVAKWGMDHPWSG